MQPPEPPLWTRSLTVIAGTTRPDDWVIKYRGVVVGRTYSDLWPWTLRWRWSWSCQTLPTAEGYTDTLDEAAECIRNAVLASTGQMVSGERLW